MVEVGSEVSMLLACQIIYEEAVFVGLISRSCHRAECQLLIVGRPYRITVVAYKLHNTHTRVGLYLVDVQCRAIFGIVDENIRIGRNGILCTGERFAGVGQFLAIVAPRNLGSVEIRRKRCVPSRFLTNNILVVLYAIGR